MSLLTGVAAVKSVERKKVVRVNDLIRLQRPSARGSTACVTSGEADDNPFVQLGADQPRLLGIPIMPRRETQIDIVPSRQ